MADDGFNNLLDQVDASFVSEAQGQPAAPTPEGTMEQPQAPAAPAQSGASFGGALQAVGVGAAKSVLETKDFIVGEPAEADKSQLRRSIEATGKSLAEESAVNAAIIPISQFVTGIIGAGKIVKAAQAIGWGFKIAKGARGARAVAESAKGAAVGAVAFDPHDERLSNLIEEFPSLSNPVTAYLAAKPSDGNAEGRLKAAVESIGMDAVMVPVVTGAMKAYRAIRSGNTKAANAAIQEAQKAAAEAEAQAAPKVAPEGAVAGEVVQPTPPPKTVAEAFYPTEQTKLSDTPMPDVLKGKTKKAKTQPFPEGEFDRLSANVIGDAQVLNAYGTREAAVEAGHKFSGLNLPWQKLATGEESLDAMIDRLTEIHMEKIGRAGKDTQDGLKITDAEINRIVTQRAKSWGDDPDIIRGQIQAAGQQGTKMAANMEVADAIAVKMADEAYTTWNKIRLGNLAEWGGDAGAAMKAFTQQAGLAMQMMTNARQMLSGAGRALRRARGDVPRMTLDELRKMEGLSPEALGRLFEQSQGDVNAMRQALSRPTLLQKAVDAANFLLVNNLLWGWVTHTVNFSSNLFESMVRPGQRALGAQALRLTGQLTADQASVLSTSAMRQYRYMAGTILDASRAALQAFVKGESIMSPYRVEFYRYAAPSRAGGVADFRTVQGLGDLVHNSFEGMKIALGLPTRALGAGDEWVKQITYRSMVMADASMEAEAKGLTGAAYKAHIQDRVNKAFDGAGEAIDQRALHEARVVTFQQQLERKGWAGYNTLGQITQEAVGALPLLRQVLPFVRTPVNVMRRGIQYTPGLNMLQKEYSEMIRGVRGAEMQAQAVGQMAVGSLFLGSAAIMAAHGMMTGSMPDNPAARRELQAIGWKPNSIAFQREDGSTTYFQLGRFDPVGLPFGIVADLMQIWQHPERRDVVENELIPMLALAFTKQIEDRTYLRGLKQMIDAASAPEKSFSKWAGQQAGNLVPFSSAFRNYGPAVDQNLAYMREVRGVVDGILATLPGFSGKVQPKMDAFGEPMLIRRAPLQTIQHDPVDAEMTRQAVEWGQVGVNVPAPRRNGVDLREVALSDGSNAYTRFQELAGKPPGRPTLKEAVARLIGREDYQRSPDGLATTRGSKQWMLSGLVATYHSAAHAQLMRDPIYRGAMEASERAARSYRAAGNTEGERNIQQQRAVQSLNDAFNLNINTGSR
jgi:hypothetical protein